MEIETKFSGFVETGSPRLGLAVIFDLSGFSAFFNLPDLQFYIKDYLNEVIETVETCLWGGDKYWQEKPAPLKALSLKPSMRKFLGDGMLYVWEDQEGVLSKDDFKVALLNRIWNLQKKFQFVNTKLYGVLPTGALPQKMKFGIAKGTVYRMKVSETEFDYIGPCINLASRLVKYCPELDFIASARLDISKAELDKNKYIRIIANSIRSFEKEIVLIDAKEYSDLPDDMKKRLFTEIKTPT